MNLLVSLNLSLQECLSYQGAFFFLSLFTLSFFHLSLSDNFLLAFHLFSRRAGETSLPSSLLLGTRAPASEFFYFFSSLQLVLLGTPDTDRVRSRHGCDELACFQRNPALDRPETLAELFSFLRAKQNVKSISTGSP